MSGHTVQDNIVAVCGRLESALQKAGRTPGSASLLAVSKKKPIEDLQAAYDAGQRAFGENYLQEALDKQQALSTLDIEWHFIGALQSNKTREIAEHFDWCHTVDRLKIARRLSEQRPDHLSPLNICLQVNISRQDSKSGVAPEEVEALAAEIATLPGLAFRGLMVIPAPTMSFNEQRLPFRALRELLETLRTDYPDQPLDTLSMGMSDDIDAAITEGSTLVRVGTAIFGARAT